MILSLCLLLPGLLAIHGQTNPQTHYIAEVLFVVEPKVFRNYIALGEDPSTVESTIREDIKFILYQVNKYYESTLPHGLSVEIRCKDLEFLSEDIFDSSLIRNGNRLTASVGLRTFRDWIELQIEQRGLEYDVAVLWTGYDLTGRSGTTANTGYATTRSACRPGSGAAIVEFDGTQSTAATTAHEIGHVIGSSHDSDFNCPAFVGHLMTPSQKVTNRHRWSFSPCSVESFKQYIARMDQYNRNCLLVTSTEPATFDIASQEGRDMMDVYKICQRAKASRDTYFCGFVSFYEGNLPHGDLVCQYLYCASSGTRSCTSVMPTEGMVCDQGKRCNQGRCVAAPPNFPTPPNVESDCVFGDVMSGRIKGKTGTCDDYIRSEGLNQCYKFTVMTECCATCRAHKIPIEGCEYGDLFQECAQYTPAQICPNNREDCCFTCRDFRARRSELDQTDVLPKMFHRVDDDDDDFEEPIRLD